MSHRKNRTISLCARRARIPKWVGEYLLCQSQANYLTRENQQFDSWILRFAFWLQSASATLRHSPNPQTKNQMQEEVNDPSTPTTWYRICGGKNAFGSRFHPSKDLIPCCKKSRNRFRIIADLRQPHRLGKTITYDQTRLHVTKGLQAKSNGQKPVITKNTNNRVQNSGGNANCTDLGQSQNFQQTRNTLAL